MTSKLLVVDGLTVCRGEIVAVAEIDLAVGARQAVAVLGANGAGKSALLKAIIGLLPSRAGRILFDGQPIDGLRADRRARLGIGYCPEGRRVFPGLTVRENLQVAAWENAAARRSRVDEMFALFPALAEKPSSPAWMLSGGQQQMLALGRSLMNRPRLLLLDEPSLGLSPKLAEALFGFLPGIVASGTSILLAEQNVARALQLCEEAVVLRRGRVVERGASTDLAAGDALRAAFLAG